MDRGIIATVNTLVFVTRPDLPDNINTFDWTVEVDEKPHGTARVIACQATDPFVWGFNQNMNEAVLRQLADMFLPAAILMRIRDHKAEIEQNKAQFQIKSFDFEEVIDA